MASSLQRDLSNLRHADADRHADGRGDRRGDSGLCHSDSVGIQTPGTTSSGFAATVSSTLYQPSNSGPAWPCRWPLSTRQPDARAHQWRGLHGFQDLNASSGVVATVVFNFPIGTAESDARILRLEHQYLVAGRGQHAGAELVPGRPHGGTITVTFDSSSFPTVTQLNGTIFTIATSVATTTRTPTNQQ